MWCPKCESDVVGEMSAEGQTLNCAHCGTTLRQIFAPSLHPETRQARQLLERWSRYGITGEETTQSSVPTPPRDVAPVDPPQLPAHSSDIVEHETAANPAPESVQSMPADQLNDPPPPSAMRAWRIDTAHPPSPRPIHKKTTPRKANAMSRGSAPSQRRSDRSHSNVPQPHFDVSAPRLTSDPGHTEAIWGQVLAYSGTGVLTIGSVLVLWGYFGAIETYASTGWLVATAGQMLLLLGIVTLVSGGMQQTTHEVGQRIEYLNGRIFRIERSTRKLLRGPHFTRSRASSAPHPDASSLDEQETDR